MIAHHEIHINRLPRRKRHLPCGGFTLLEVLLALFLSVVVLTIISMFLRVHLHAVEMGRRESEKSQLARSILRRIADDLRGAIPYNPQDISSSEQIVESLTIIEIGPEAEAVPSISQSDEAPTGPGLYGNSEELQVDVSRLPRPDQYEPGFLAEQDTGLADRMSDVKTIAYYVDRIEPDSRTGDFTGLDTGVGLVRRALDRATTRWAQENGSLLSLNRKAKLLAPEVRAIEFRYFDGLEWTDEWDSQYRGGLPMAVEITLLLGEADTEPSPSPFLSPAGETESVGTVHRMVVHLPAAEPTSLEFLDPLLEEETAP